MTPEKLLLYRAWIVFQEIGFGFYFFIGAFYSITSGPYHLLLILDIPFLNYYYPGYAGSLVIFGIFGLYCLWQFKAKALPIFLIAYSIFEVLPAIPPSYLITLVIALAGAASFAIARPKINYRDPKALLFLGLVVVMSVIRNYNVWPNTTPFYESNLFAWEMTVIGMCVLFFEPEKPK